MIYFSVFSGVEGIGMGLPPEWKPIGFSEWDKYASQVLKYHYPNITNHGDCLKINWNEIPDFDLLTGGSPCQDFSVAGKRRGLKGAKSALAWEYIRCLRAKQPRYFLWENVKGVMSSRGGWDFANLLCAFSESGYSLWWQVLNAKDFGVPQNRERIFVVGFREGSPKEIYFEPKNSGQIEIVGTTIGEENTRHGERDSVYSGGGIMGGLRATGYKQPPQILVIDPYNRTIPSDQKATTTLRTNHTNGNPQIMVMNKGESQHYRLCGEDGLAPTLQSQSGMSSQKHPFVVVRNMQPRSANRPSLKYSSGGSGHFSKENETYTIDTGNTNAVELNGKVRKLMPIECERLMSWPDERTRWGINEQGEKVEISDSQRYKMCGNGVVSNVVREIAKHLF